MKLRDFTFVVLINKKTNRMMRYSLVPNKTVLDEQLVLTEKFPGTFTVLLTPDHVREMLIGIDVANEMYKIRKETK